MCNDMTLSVLPSYQYSHDKYYKDQLHLDVVDRYLRLLGDKTIRLESFYPP